MSLNLPNALSLYEELQKSANNFTVFVPVNSAVVPKVSRIMSSQNRLSERYHEGLDVESK